MKKLFFVAVLIAISAAFFASTHPDGLDFIAEKFGFAARGMEQPVLMFGYSIPFLPAGGVSTAVAGIAGIIIILVLFFAAVYLFKNWG